MEDRGQDIQRMYRLRFAASRAAKDRIWKILVERYFQKWIGLGDVVLDLGCGYGEFLNHLRCARRIGVDMNPDSAEALSESVEFHRSSIVDVGFLADQSVDVVFTSNVMEHLADKGEVERMLEGVRRVLRPGGQLIAMGPNLRCLPGAYWDFWDHRVPITDRCLAEVLCNLGFEVTARIPRFLPYSTCSSVPQHPALVRLYLAVPWVWPIMGKQFLVRARKPAK